MTSVLITTIAVVGLFIVIIVAFILYRLLSDNFGQHRYVYSHSGRRRRRRSRSRIFLLGILAGILGGAALGYWFILQPSQSATPPNPTSAAVQTTTTPQPSPTPQPTSTLPAHLQNGPFIRDITTNADSYPNGEIPRYQKLELTFQVETLARNLQLPYDPAPPPGVEPGLGITVDAHFTPDNWQTVFIQPAFYYQDFENETENGQPWLYPTANFAWQVRFTPHQAGDWQFKLVAQDAAGQSETDNYNFTVTSSDQKGFLRVSPNDPRYFEFEDGAYFPALGYNLALPAEPETFQTMAENGLQLVRTWLPSQFSIFGSAWSPWSPFGAAPMPAEPNARLRYDAAPPFNLTPGVDPPLARPESELFLWLSHDETEYRNGIQWDLVPCAVWGWQSPRLPVKADADYRIRVRYREHNLTGPKVTDRPYGFVVKMGDWLWGDIDELRCYHPDAGRLLAASYSESDRWTHYPDPENEGWQILEGRFRNGNRNFLPLLYLAIENATGGDVLVDYVWLEEDLGNGQFGPNVIHRPWMAHHLYFDQRGSFAFDQALELAEQAGLYFKLVVLEKNDFALNIFEPDGSLSTTLPENNPARLFFGQGRESEGKTKIRWLQEAWWRYLQARWGYSPHIHSWELLNEGDPEDPRHYILADEMGKYFRTAFVPAGQSTPHPNLHLVTTSFWHSFPESFWNSPDYPYVDYADIHHYAQESNTEPLDYIYDSSDFYDAALFSEKLSLHHGAKQPNGAGKPLIRGETGFLFDRGDPFARNAADGLWLHNFIWAGLNSGGLIELLWTGAPTQAHIYRQNSHDHRPMFRTYYNFIQDIPLNNGHYQDAAAISSSADIRVWGQKDLVNGRGHLWLQNINHTWKKVLDGESIPPAAGLVTVTGFQPGQSYRLEWWDTYQPDPARQIIAAETVVASADGAIEISVVDLATDIAVKINPF